MVIALRVISKCALVRFEITSMISDQNCTHEVQLPLKYIHFEITLFQKICIGPQGWFVRRGTETRLHVHVNKTE